MKLSAVMNLAVSRRAGAPPVAGCGSGHGPRRVGESTGDGGRCGVRLRGGTGAEPEPAAGVTRGTGMAPKRALHVPTRARPESTHADSDSDPDPCAPSASRRACAPGESGCIPPIVTRVVPPSGRRPAASATCHAAMGPERAIHSLAPESALTIVPVATASASRAPVAPDRRRVSVSAPSLRASWSTGTSTVRCVCPGANTSRPDVAT